jgi:hypothetical protein
MKNGLKSRENHSIILWNGRKRIPSYAERILVASEQIH